jgi:predicted aconitase
MKLNEEEQAMLAGELGEPRRWAIEHMMRVGKFFDAPDFVEVTQAHIMADTESLGEAGVEFLENMASCAEAERRVRIPMITTSASNRPTPWPRSSGERSTPSKRSAS